MLTDPSDPNVTRQNPQYYIVGCERIIRGAITQAQKNDPHFSPSKVISIGVDTTASTVTAVDAAGTPLAFDPQFSDNLNAVMWLWKDHTAFREAEQITRLAQVMRPQYLEKCGGTYSSKWS